ncbi:hypothetical protein [Hyphomicrobium sp. ghe19]|uniref:hypothetical protein n=1 Tax=Hyphomicrobium sp. ghe19 TaxID=2682968 RepID=UPI00136794B6|nr:hypothetical protein HYPP_04382 [Hyphomicrobium sp. ghe19]
MSEITYHQRDGKFIVTGIEEAVLKKARELIQIEPNTPKGMRDGLCYYEYQGHFLCSDTKQGHGFWYIQTIDGSKLPPELEGNFTSQTLAQQVIVKHGDPKAKENGSLIIERKRAKREQEKLAGTRDPLPREIEEHKIIEKTFLESELKASKPEVEE